MEVSVKDNVPDDDPICFTYRLATLLNRTFIALSKLAAGLQINYLGFLFLGALKSNANQAEDAAKILREQWDLGYDPIPDVVKMLEDKGYFLDWQKRC